MKKILAFLALVQIQVSLAGLPEFIVSPRDIILTPGPNNPILELPIYEGRSSYFLIRWASCFGDLPDPEDQEVIINGNDIKVFSRQLPSSTRCTPLPPPSYLNYAKIPALSIGIYNLSYYHLPSNVTPNDDDLPNYLVYDLNFSVLAAINVDLLSTWGIASLTLLLLTIGFNGLKKQRRKTFIN